MEQTANTSPTAEVLRRITEVREPIRFALPRGWATVGLPTTLRALLVVAAWGVGAVVAVEMVAAAVDEAGKATAQVGAFASHLLPGRPQ